MNPATPPPPPALASVLITCLGQLEHARLCVRSLLRHTYNPFELVFLDLGSLDGTAPFLAGVETAARVPVEVVRSVSDGGIPAAVQEALARAKGEFLVLLNNDTVLTDDWLGHLVALAQLAPDVGLVGPVSNYAPAAQLVKDVPYRIGPSHSLRARADGLVPRWEVDVSGLERFAAVYREQNRGKWMEVDRLGGFCLLVKRAVLDQLGPVEGASGLGLFDTDNLCVKARQAGFRLACCLDAYIHHFGSRTFVHGGPATEPATPARPSDRPPNGHLVT